MAAQSIELIASQSDDRADDTPRQRLRLLRPFVTRLLEQETGPELMASLLTLMGRDDLSAREWVEVTAAWKALIGFCTAGQLTCVAELDRELNPILVETEGDGGYPAVTRTADELAPVLRIAPRSASVLVSLVRRVQDLPAAMDAVADGRMDMAQLRGLDATARDLPQPARRLLEDAAVRWAPRRTAAQLRGDLAAEAIRLDPEHAERACDRGTSERDVHLRPSPLPGCRRLVADLPMVAANACWLALNGAARTARGAEGRNGRPLPQLRADVLTAVLTGSIAAAGADQGFDRGYDRSGHDRSGHDRNGHDRNGEQPSDSRQAADVPTQDELSRHIEIRVVVSADTLSRARDLPGSLPGVGPLDPGTVRALAARSPWRRLVADPVSGTLLHADRHLLQPAAPEPLGGAPTADPDHERGEDPSSDPRLAALLAQPVMPERLDHGIDRYRPSPSLRMHVLTRDGTCVGPACHHPAGGSQLDHTTNYGERAPDGTVGTTSHTNLGALCARTHNSKTHGGWDLDQPAPGSFTWTSPTGRTYSRACRPLVHGWSADGETDAALGDSG